MTQTYWRDIKKVFIDSGYYYRRNWKILSLFDGMSCGFIAALDARILPLEYHAYEIDKYAIKTSQHNFPEIEHHGDVFAEDFTKYEGTIDLLCGGSPCTHWSIAQTKNRETTASGIGWELFSQYVRALREAKPRYFIYENNKSMSKDIRRSIDETFGFEAICINSALVSAQNRQRLYWVGKRNDDGTYSKVDVEQPEDMGILLKDVLDGAEAFQEKAYAYTTRCQAATIENTLGKHQHTMVAEPVGSVGNMYGKGQNGQLYGLDSKTKTLSAGTGISGRGIGSNNSPKVIIPAYPVADADGKAHVLTCSYDKAVVWNSIERSQRTMIAEPVAVRQVGRRINEDGHRDDYNEDIERTQRYEVNDDPSKTNCLSTVSKDNMVAEPINTTAEGKAQCVRASCYKDGIRNIVANDVDRRTGVAVSTTEQVGALPRPNGELSTSQAFRIYSEEAKSVTLKAQGGGSGAKTGLYAIRVQEATTQGYTDIEPGDCVDLQMPNSKTRRGRNMKEKSNCLTTTNDFYQYMGTTERPIYEVKDGMITIKGKTYPIKLRDGSYYIRKLTVSECKRLQTVPDWFSFDCVSNSQAYKMLGNGWTISVISWLMEAILRSDDNAKG